MKCRHCNTEINTSIQEADGSVICPGCGAVYRRKVASQQSRTNSNQNNSKKTAAPAYDKAGFDTTASKVIKKTSSSPNDNIEKNQKKQRKSPPSLLVRILIAALVFVIYTFIQSQHPTNMFFRPFSIEGKWKNTGSYTYGQVQNGAIVSFDGTNCNVVSPADTYAFYKNGSNYRLDCTTMLFSETQSFTVKVTDKNHISIYVGNNSLDLSRIS